MADREQSHATPFMSDNSTGYTAAEMDALNAEFERRWNGWQVQESQLFKYADDELMTEEDAIKAFRDEVSRR